MSRSVNAAIAALACLSVIFLFVSSGEPVLSFLEGTMIEPLLHALSWPNTIVFNLSVGYLTSTIFWILVVYLPERSRRRLVREALAVRYKEFKYEIVQTFLWAADRSEETRFVEELANDYEKFKTYFKSTNQTWYDVLNGIQSNSIRMHELQLAMTVFADHVAFAMSSVPVDDPDAHRVLLRLRENIFRLNNSETDLYDRVKHVGGFLWSILARWSIIEGQLQDDIIDRMIARI